MHKTQKIFTFLFFFILICFSQSAQAYYDSHGTANTGSNTNNNVGHGTFFQTTTTINLTSVWRIAGSGMTYWTIQNGTQQPPNFGNPCTTTSILASGNFSAANNGSIPNGIVLTENQNYTWCVQAVSGTQKYNMNATYPALGNTSFISWGSRFDSNARSDYFQDVWALGFEVISSYNISISQPRTSFPVSVSTGTNFSINFTFTKDDVNITNASQLTITNISVGSLTCPVVYVNSTCTGTENACSSYTTNSTCTAAGCGTFNGTDTITAFKGPSTNSILMANGWVNPTQAYTNDNLYATGGIRNSTNYSGYAFGIPAGATINGIEIVVEAFASSSTGTNQVFIRIGNGSNWSGENTTGDISTGATNTTFGSLINLWGLSWNGANMSNMFVNLTSGASSTRIMSVDMVLVRVNYTVNSCFGTPTTCPNLANNITQCTSSGCSGVAGVQQYACYSAYCQVNCTAPGVLSGFQNLSLFVNYTVDSIFLNASQLSSVNYSIIADTCTYSSGNWAVACSDNCLVNSNVDVGGNNITFSGTGSFTLSGANITGGHIIRINTPCVVSERNGGRIRLS